MAVDLNYFLNYTKQNVSSVDIQELSDEYSEQYNSTISPFNVLVNSDRADTIYKDTQLLKCVVDYGREWRKSDFNPLAREVWIEHNAIQTGDVVDFENKKSKERQTYLFISNIETRDSYDVGYMQQCNYTLKHLNSNNKLISTPCIATNATMYSLGVEENKEVKMPDGKLSIQVPYNDDTKEITRDKRFIFHKFPYQVTFLDYAQVDNKNHIGLIGLILQETEKLDQDDIVNQIAYNGEINISLEVTPMDVNLTLLDTIQLSAVIKYNDTIVNKETIWTSNDELIATIDELGNVSPIAEGICQLRCELKDNPNVYQLVNVNVVSVVSDNYEVVITGDNEIREFESKEYTAKLLNNGVEIPTQFDFIIDYLGNNSKIAELIVIDDNTCKIQANSQSIYGYVKLIVTDKNNINNIAELNIKIRSLW